MFCSSCVASAQISQGCCAAQSTCVLVCVGGVRTSQFYGIEQHEVTVSPPDGCVLLASVDNTECIFNFSSTFTFQTIYKLPILTFRLFEVRFQRSEMERPRVFQIVREQQLTCVREDLQEVVARIL